MKAASLALQGAHEAVLSHQEHQPELLEVKNRLAF